LEDVSEGKAKGFEKISLVDVLLDDLLSGGHSFLDG